MFVPYCPNVRFMRGFEDSNDMLKLKGKKSEFQVLHVDQTTDLGASESNTQYGCQRCRSDPWRRGECKEYIKLSGFSYENSYDVCIVFFPN